ANNPPGTTVTAVDPANYFGDTIPTADLQVTITNGATTLVPGTSDTYTITVTNNGTDPVSSFNLIDTIPDALLNATFGSPSAGSYDPGSGLWSALSLASGQSCSSRSAACSVARPARSATPSRCLRRPGSATPTPAHTS